jgi:hypothetical protein
MKKFFNKQPINIISLSDDNNKSIEFNNERHKYLTSDNVSLHLINLTMEHHFPTSELVLQYSETHRDYKIKMSDVLSNNSIKNWQFNRPPDPNRCPDIAKSIYNSKRPIDTKLYMGYNHKTNIFEVIDGIHRLTALKIIKQENSKDLDLLENSDFGSNLDATWLYNQYIIVNIRFGSSASNSELINAFENLNKCQVVPNLYICDQSREKREVIDSIANEWGHIYKKHFTSSSNPIIGNTNRNKFVELLDKIYDKYNLDGSDINKLKQLLNSANAKIRANVPKKIGIEMRAKCIETGCYLFLHKNYELESII